MFVFCAGHEEESAQVTYGMKENPLVPSPVGKDGSKSLEGFRANSL